MENFRILLVLLLPILQFKATDAYVPFEHHNPCSIFDTVNITSGQKDKFGNIHHEGVVYSSKEYGIFDYIYDERRSYVKVPSHIRGCLCQKKPCVRLCCPHGQIANEYEGKCTDHPDHEVFMNVTTQEDDNALIRLHKEEYGILHNKPCEKMYILMPEEYGDDKWYFLKVSEILVSGFLHLNLNVPSRMVHFCWNQGRS